LATPLLRKLASVRKNTRQNPDAKQTVPVSDPEKILKPRGLFKQNTVVYQPKSTQSKVKIPLEPSSSREISLEKTSDSTVEAETLNPELILPKIKAETSPTTSYVSRGETSTVNLIPINIPLTLDTNLSATRGFEEGTTHSDSTLVGSPIYVSCKSEEPSPHIPSLPFPAFTSPDKKFSKFLPLHLGEARESLYIFANPLYNALISSPRLSMVAAEGGVGGQGQQPLPRVFAKVAARYAPFVLPVPLHD
jgi:hypothetical protein